MLPIVFVCNSPLSLLILGPNALCSTLKSPSNSGDFSNFGAIFQVTSVSLNSAISSTAFLAPLAIASWQQPLQLFGGFSDATLRRDVISYSAIVSATTALSAPWPVAVELNTMRMQSLEGNL